MHEAVRRLRPDAVIEAAGYIRVSDPRQMDTYSPDVQRDAIKRLAAQEGFALTLIEQDVQKGRVITRTGYQRIVEAVRAGTIHAVIVFMFDRWGRNGAEWLTRAQEFDRLGVPMYSVQQGKDPGGIMRFVYAGMAEEYSRQLGQRVRPSRESGAREGTHMGPTPLGYRRVYPPITDPRKRPPGRLEPDPETAWVVQELFRRYADGGWSLVTLAKWLNSDPRVPQRPPRPPRPGEEPTERVYRASSVQRVLTNPTYLGLVRYNHTPSGVYDRAEPGSEFTEQGKHEPLVDQETFDRVQVRLAAAGRRQSYNRRQDAPLGAGLFVCAGCGGPMTPCHYPAGKVVYKCSRRREGSGCAVPGYLARTAEAALLREVSRLCGSPWTPQGELRLAGGERAAEVRGLAEALAGARERLNKQTRLMTLLEDDPTPEQVASFRAVSGEISREIRTLEGQIAALVGNPVDVGGLRRLHARLVQTEVAQLVAGFARCGDVEGLRALVQGLVEEVRIVERVPHARARWLRAEVIWKEDVATLLLHGLLTLDLAARPQGSTPRRPGAERSVL
jgi:DNA invertase Pin-like site-specific DNA recombinase